MSIEQADLDAVAGRERHRRQQLAGAGVLAAERLEQAGQLGPQRGQQRARDQLGDPAAAVGVLAAADLQRPPVEALDQVHAVGGQQRAEQLGHEHRVGVDEVGVDEDDEVAGGRGQRAPQHLALAGLRRHLGQRVLAADHAGARRERPDLGVVGGAGVQHDQLVDQPAEQRGDGLHHRGDGLFLVERGQDHRDGAARLGGISSSTVQDGRLQLWSAASGVLLRRRAAVSSGVRVMPVPSPCASVDARPGSTRPFPARVEWADLMHPEHGGPVGGGQRRRGQGALQAFGQSHTQSLPDEVLVAQRHQDGPSGIYKIFYVAQQTKAVVSVLAEIVGRIDQDRVPGHARRDRAFGRRGHLGDDVVDHAASGCRS